MILQCSQPYSSFLGRKCSLADNRKLFTSTPCCCRRKEPPTGTYVGLLNLIPLSANRLTEELTVFNTYVEGFLLYIGSEARTVTRNFEYLIGLDITFLFSLATLTCARRNGRAEYTAIVFVIYNPSWGIYIFR